VLNEHPVLKADPESVVCRRPQLLVDKTHEGGAHVIPEEAPLPGDATDFAAVIGDAAAIHQVA